MDTKKITAKGVKMVAHRGLSGIETENTNAAFIAAGNRNYYGIETDLHVTKDGMFVLIHDSDTGRVCNFNINVEKTKYGDVRSYLLRDKYGDNSRGDLVIPNLREYISTCKRYDKKAVLEIKSNLSDEDVTNLIDEIEHLEYLDGVIFIAFGLGNLIKLRERLPEQKMQYLTESGNIPELIDTLTKYKLDIDINKGVLTEEIIKKFHDNGITVNCWTCDDPARAEELASWGVDMITTNILEKYPESEA